MLARLAVVLVRRRRIVLVASLVFFAVAGGVGGGAVDMLKSGGFEDPGAESTKAAATLEKTFGQTDPNVVMVVTANQATVDDPAVAAAGANLTKRLGADDGVEFAGSYWTLGNAPPLRSNNGRQALVLARLGGTEAEVDERVPGLLDKYTGSQGPITVQITGLAAVFQEVGHTIESDLAKAEAIALVITLILMIFVFGGLVAALLPLGIGILSIVGTLLVLRVVASLTDVSIFALNLTTLMGLGLAIDYSLFVLSRFREELANGLEVPDAVVQTMRTAGRTVVFSALTVAVSLSALLIFPLYFLRSFAYAGIAVVAVAAIGSVVVLPALLAALGPRVDALSWRRGTRTAKPTEDGFWHRTAVTVMRRPWPFALGVTALLLALGGPFLGIKLGVPDDRVLPPSATTRAASDQIRANFSSQEAFAVQVVAGDIGPAATHRGEIVPYAEALSRIDGVARVDALTGSYADGAQVAPPTLLSARFGNASGTWLSVVPGIEPVSLEGERLVRDVRDLKAPFPIEVGGASAELVDSKDSLFRLLPIAGLLIAIVTFIALFLMFGSLLVPAKAVVLNLLSLSATFGAMVWIFQDGHGQGLLDFTATGTLVATTPILMFCIAFGLSMDYEVFLLSRIKEEHDRTGDNEKSVAVGLEKTGRIVTAAAALLAVVFLATITSGVSFIKLFGLGLALAVVMDATVIRGLLVPAFMRLAGEANWWAPAPLRKVYERWGFSESGGDPGPPTSTAEHAVSDRYRRSMIAAAVAASSEAELHELLSAENITTEDLVAWRAKVGT